MQNNVTTSTEEKQHLANQDNIFSITVIEESNIQQDALCHSLGCA